MAEVETGSISDGYHTFDELYQHRAALFLALCHALGLGWRSHLHADGTYYKGWFIVGVTLPMVGDITYHLPCNQWDNAGHLLTLPRALSWDGHTPAEVVNRLTLYATLDEVPHG